MTYKARSVKRRSAWMVPCALSCIHLKGCIVYGTDVEQAIRRASTDFAQRVLSGGKGETSIPRDLRDRLGQSTTELVSIVARQPDHTQRMEACLALAMIGTPAAATALLAALEDRHLDVRKAAAYALGRIGGPASITALRNCLKHVAQMPDVCQVGPTKVNQGSIVKGLRETLERALARQESGP